MERDSEYQSFLLNNNGGSGEFVTDYSSSSDAFNAMFSGVSFLSLLTANFHQPPPPAMPHLFADPFSPPGSSGLDLLKTPKPEPLPPLPGLLSLEHPHPHPQPRAGDKRARAEPWAEAHRWSFRSPGPAPRISPPAVPAPASAAMVPRSSALQRQRRQRLGEKTRCLQRVLPWDTKMDMATLLEETYKYVKFLEAQLAALSAMPQASGGGGDDDGLFGGLGRLSRNQVLQVLVNSPVAQTTLYSKGFCVFSVEQVGLIEKVAQMRRLKTTNFLLPNHFSSF